MKLSPNFTSFEMARSKRFPHLQTPFERLQPIIAANLTRLVVEFLQPLRDRFGKIEVLSGYRNRALNTAVGGAVQSRHMRGLAYDFIPREANQLAVWQWIVSIRMARLVSFDRLAIYTTVSPVTFHVDLREWEHGLQRRRFFRGSPWQELEREDTLAIALGGM